MRIALALALAFACSSAQAADEIYRCKGADGVTVYSGKPCGIDAEPVTLRPEPALPVTEDTTVRDFHERKAAEKAMAAADLEARAAADAASSRCDAETFAVEQQLDEVRHRNAVDGPLAWNYASMYVVAEAERAKAERINELETHVHEMHAACDALWQATYEAR